jgi:2,4-dienoyl-CoA reductase-like NADH-dependent reductase (Old Yellow Enzyme family)
MNTSQSALRAQSRLASLADAVHLPCGAQLPNRLAKAAMSELLADPDNRATQAHATLYDAWAQSGPGMMLTGNVQVDRQHLEHPGNVALSGPQPAEHLAQLRAWSSAAKRYGGQIWMQLSHAGRQTSPRVNRTPKAPSNVPLKMGSLRFEPPEPLTGAEVRDLIAKFAEAAATARTTGFDGVQLHAAHGYLFSQFLSPRANLRGDEWGGNLEGRARFLLQTIHAVRQRVGADYPISVKLNSSDFLRGGFDFDDCQAVVAWLDEASVDLIEISGGTYEQPRMLNIAGFETVVDPVTSPTGASKEAYFAKFAPLVRQRLRRAKLMVTGGFRSAEAMVDAVANGVDVVGLGKPLCLAPTAPAALLSGTAVDLRQPKGSARLGPGILGPQSPIRMVRAINALGGSSWYNLQILRLAAGQSPDPRAGFLPSFMKAQKREQAMAQALRR